MEEILKRLQSKRLKESEDYTEESHVLADYSKLPDYLYTVTLYNRLDDIAKYGFGDKSHKTVMGDVYHDTLYDGDGIFLATDPKAAMEYLSGNEDAEDIVLLRVPKSVLSRSKLYYDTNEESTLNYLNGETDLNSNVTYFYADVIPNPQKVLTIMD